MYQQNCVSREVPASVSLQGWGGVKLEAGGDIIVVKAEFLLQLGNPHNDFPYVNAKLG